MKVHGGKLKRPLYVSRVGVKMMPRRKTLAKKVAKLAKRCKETDELKFFDTALSFNVDTTMEIPASGQLALIPQNDTQSGRDGRKAVVDSIFIKFQTTNTSATSLVSNTLSYIWVIQDRQANGAAATVSNADTGIFTTASAPTSQLVLANADRFKILKKFYCYNLRDGSAHSANTGTITIAYYEAYIKCNIPIEYDASAATGALTTIRSNNIFLVAGSDQVSDDTMQIDGSCRLRFRG